MIRVTENQSSENQGLERIRIEIEKDNNELTLRIVYPRKVWDKLKSMYEKAGLERYTTHSLFGKLTAEVYRYTAYSGNSGNDILTYVKNALIAGHCPGVEVIDDINENMIDLNRFNMSIFRVVPKCDNDSCVTQVKIRDGSLLFTKPHFRCFSLALKHYVQAWLNLTIALKWRYEALMEIQQ